MVSSASRLRVPMTSNNMTEAEFVELSEAVPARSVDDQRTVKGQGQLDTVATTTRAET
ncbi:hypothetical protein ABZ154_33535 [Streptomyces sp. NPDC006261]|uniref:hypothetical protein n=1 Tax=Streptomyces sp. NPDC006261 TaxID=3156739 RepID=UPI0033BF3D8B